MTTIESVMAEVFKDRKRDISSFRAPKLVDLAADLDVPPQKLRQWFAVFQAEVGANPCHRLHEGVFIAFLDWLKLERLVDG